jgi:hypothetical protein
VYTIICVWLVEKLCTSTGPQRRGDLSDVVGPRKEFRANGLFESVQAAFSDLQNAHTAYQHAFKAAAGTDLGSNDGMTAIQQQGRVYAEAVTRYSNAVMALLVAVETNKGDAVELLRKRKGAGV